MAVCCVAVADGVGASAGGSACFARGIELGAGATYARQNKDLNRLIPKQLQPIDDRGNLSVRWLKGVRRHRLSILVTRKDY